MTVPCRLWEDPAVRDWPALRPHGSRPGEPVALLGRAPGRSSLFLRALCPKPSFSTSYEKESRDSSAIRRNTRFQALEKMTSITGPPKIQPQIICIAHCLEVQRRRYPILTP